MNPAGGPFDLTLLHEVAGFLYAEAACLDDRDFTGWLALMADDVTYRMPVRATRMRLGGDEFFQDVAHYDETRETLAMRVQRLGTPCAWAGDPPSRTRHFVTNIRVQPGAAGDEYAVRSNVLVYRNRGDSPHYRSAVGRAARPPAAGRRRTAAGRARHPHRPVHPRDAQPRHLHLSAPCRRCRPTVVVACAQPSTTELEFDK